MQQGGDGCVCVRIKCLLGEPLWWCFVETKIVQNRITLICLNKRKKNNTAEMTEQLGTCIAKMWTQVFQMKVENKSVIFFCSFHIKRINF